MPEIKLENINKVFEITKSAGDVMKAVQATATDNDVLSKLGRIFSEVNKFIEKLPKQEAQSDVIQSREPRNPPNLMPQHEIIVPAEIVPAQKEDKLMKFIKILLTSIEPYLTKCPDDMTIGQAIAGLDILKVSEVKALLQIYKGSQK